MQVTYRNQQSHAINSISGLVVEYIVAIDVTRVRFPADASCCFCSSLNRRQRRHPLVTFDGIWWPPVAFTGGLNRWPAPVICTGGLTSGLHQWASPVANCSSAYCCYGNTKTFAGTVAILAQGTSWAVASSQASFGTGPSSNPPPGSYCFASLPHASRAKLCDRSQANQVT